MNRDDTGSPKDALFGGVRRGRISSQCLKRSIRFSPAFRDAFEDGLLGVRTRSLPDLIKKELEGMGVSPVDSDKMIGKLNEIIKGSKKESEAEEAEQEDEEIKMTTQQLVFLGKGEIKPFAERLKSVYDEIGANKWEKEKAKDIAQKLGGSLPKSVDIAMFGRMTTSSTIQDVAAAVQVAHAITANALKPEFDYFTAVDDLSNESGAGMIGDIEFNSSTYYKYINVHWEQLLNNLGGDIRIAQKAILALLEAAATSQPSGKQNTFAAHNLPDFIMVEINKRNLPVSYANAFLTPARQSHEKTMMKDSIEAFASYMGTIKEKYDIETEKAYLSTVKTSIEGCEEVTSLTELSKWLGKNLPES
ncbi:MAG: type I-E CRISPR-associated protein Cas7/Cse4/CasC [Anaerolineaceae bacterium]|nr:type I-E CRISPR-associated protein Cas7/Cse4/CasC [Anaerolineaceae bacterium]